MESLILIAKRLRRIALFVINSSILNKTADKETRLLKRLHVYT